MLLKDSRSLEYRLVSKGRHGKHTEIGITIFRRVHRFGGPDFHINSLKTRKSKCFGEVKGCRVILSLALRGIQLEKIMERMLAADNLALS